MADDDKMEDHAELHGKFAQISDLVGLLQSEMRLEDVLDCILRGATEILEAQACSILLLDETRNVLRFAASSSEASEKLKALIVPADHGIAGWVIEHDQPAVVGDLSKDERHYGKIAETLRESHRSLLAIPLKLKDRVAGVMEAVRFANQGPFQPEDIELLRVFSDEAAEAIEKAKILETRTNHDGVRKSKFAARFTFDDILTRDQFMLEVVAMARKAASTEATVLITGESGTGKEVLAQAIHNASRRADGPFLAINCGAIPETLLESELFGYEKGAFTGAHRLKPGRVEQANGGTLFLDEIAELPQLLQVKILRVLQDRVIERLGGSEPIPVDIRVIAATNRNLRERMKKGEFREDLFYRLNVIPLHVPPLRSRKADIPVLTERFLAQCAQDMRRSVPDLVKDSIDRLLDYPWPGNIRELQNVVERTVVLSSENDMEFAEIAADPKRTMTGETLVTFKEAQSRFKRRYIMKILDHAGGNQSLAARLLGIQRTYLSHLIKDLEIPVGRGGISGD